MGHIDSFIQTKSGMREKLTASGSELQAAEIGINQQMLPVFLGILLAAVIAWIFLSRQLYEVLRQNFPQVYKTLGSPKLIMEKSLTTNYRVIRFLLEGAYESTGDPDVIRLCRGLRSVFFIYVICFAGCLLLLLDKMF